MVHSLRAIVVAIAFWGLMPMAACAQEPSEDLWLRLCAGGHTGSVQSLAFTPDGRRLCSAGLDKVVQVWNLSAATRDIRRIALRERTIRWQVARGLRGSIYALAAAPTDGLLAMGGYGAMGSLGDVMVVQPVSGALVQSLRGLRQTVCALAFSTNGEWLAAADVSGQVLVWNRRDWKPVTLVEPDAKTYDADSARRIEGQPKLRPIVFLGNDRVVVPVLAGVEDNGRLRWQLRQIRVDKPQDSTTLDIPHQGVVTALAATADGSLLASADLGGKLWVIDPKGSASPRQLQPGATVLSLALAADGRTLLAGTAVMPGRPSSQLQVWDLDTQSVRRNRNLPDHVRACKLSADGLTFAYVGGKDHEVFVERIDLPDRTDSLGGKGRRVLKVAFSGQSPTYRIGWGTQAHNRGFNDYADIESTFDPVRLELGTGVASQPADWLTPEAFQGTWTVARQADGTLRLFDGGQSRGRIAIDRRWEGQPRCYCWIPGPGGAPAALAVGTDVQNSVYVFGLAADGDCPILRRFRGHADYVTSVSVSRDARYLISGSADGTMCFWSLADYQRGATTAGRWGATFAVRDNRLVAEKVHPAGPLFARGVRSGDVLAEVRWPAETAERLESNPSAIVQQLEQLPWNAQVMFQFRRGDVARPGFQRLPAWEPLATLFVASDREWAFWTPSGYYEASPEGHKLFGWQINRGVDQMPDFYRADQFRKRLERPDMLERLLSAGSVDEALRPAAGRPAAELQTVLPGQIALAPRVDILSPLPGELVANQVARVRTRIILPGTSQLARAKVFANGVSATRRELVDEHPRAGGHEVTYDWDVPLPADPRNLIHVVVSTDAGVAATAGVVIERPAFSAEAQPRLHLIAIGINSYRDPAIRRLAYALADAQAIAKVLPARARGVFRQGEIRLLDDEKVTPEVWHKTLDEFTGRLKGQVRPDDLLVLYFAGHGFVDSQSGEYYFVGHNFRAEELEKRSYEACIAWKDFERLSDLPCRKLALLDTCHSGAIRPLNNRNAKAAIRTLQDDVIFTMAASAGDERSEENKEWQHGAFTKCLLEALEGQALKPGRPEVTLNDTVDYVRHSVSQLTQGRQNPMAGPSEILPYVWVRMALRDPGE